MYFYASIKDRVADWIFKKQSPIYCLQNTYFRAKNTQRVKNVKGRKKIFHANWKQQESGDSSTHIRQNKL